jgi:hypothetical protein
MTYEKLVTMTRNSILLSFLKKMLPYISKKNTYVVAY